MNNRIFCVQVAVKTIEGSNLASDWFAAYVDVYLAAPDIQRAVREAESYLLTDKVQPHCTDAACVIELDEYASEPSDEHSPTKDDLKNLLQNGGVWHSTFYGNPPESYEIEG